MSQENRENYLRTIYCLFEKTNLPARSIDIAKYLKVTKASVSEMLRKLRDDKLIKMESYKGVELSRKGLNIAKKLTYKHRVSEIFLCSEFNMDKNKIHDAAHKLEHVLSDEVAEKMAEKMNFPIECPHGGLIPK